MKKWAHNQKSGHGFRGRMICSVIHWRRQEGPAQAKILRLNRGHEMCAPARGWLAWNEVFSYRVDLSSRQGFFIVSRFVFCQQILSADFYRQQICLLSADSVSRFLSSADLSFVSRFCQQISLFRSFHFCQQISVARFLKLELSIMSTDSVDRFLFSAVSST